MILTAEQIRFLLAELAYETVVEPSNKFPYRIQRRQGGYQDGVAGKTQAALSIMLEATSRAAPRAR